MVRIDGGGVICAVAAVTGVRCIGIVTLVTGITIVGDGDVSSRKRINRVMIKG